MVRFAALRFAEDENISDRTYWYRAPFALHEGDRVFAPIGSHDRLQRARVERVLTAPAEEAPYDVRFLKDVAAPCGAFRRRAEGHVFYETGGISYDAKHFTRYGRVLFGACAGELRTLERIAADDGLQALKSLAGSDRAAGCVLAGGQAHLAAAALMLIAGGTEGDVLTRLAQCGIAAPCQGEATALAAHISKEEAARLADRLR